ncbi:uncharacterized protein ACA1_384670 [Acanthamoeba castellanii str. Neff]|uniref:Uncharacterized protein n=1 Tax=Acanthamoeba castellanii (strain ATCC 30010 / Neff) TaxID=1257118 RepID=L8H929_ACACF|nr:uncharacterized protein ACA1_384670 [Acanthamoeba castellanii str. Neff]ELR21732.1 hypothetical protein ACA1_384670 [Acanthamoeba castellanii str. Neff]
MLDEGHSAKEVAKAIQAKRLDLAQAHPLSRPAHRDRRFFARLLAERAATTDATTDPLAADTTATPVSGISWRVLSCIRLSTGMPPDAYMYVHGLVASLALDFMTPDQFERTLERDPATAAYVEGFAPTDPASMPRETRATR